MALGGAVCRVWSEAVPGMALGGAVCRVWSEEVPGMAVRRGVSPHVPEDVR
jgi:hypothetical protein